MATALALTGRALAQNSTCEITITGSFDSECIYDFKDDIFDETADFMVACRNSEVTYTAYANTGGAGIVGYTWEIYGDSVHTVTPTGEQVVVEWGSTASIGMIIVSVETTTGEICSKAVRVKVTASPTVGAETIPAYTILSDGSKVIRVCKGETVQFVDQTTADGSDIAGWNWECMSVPLADPASTPNYTIENVTSDETVVHRVYNNCGCYDEEIYFIELLEGGILELECYGTVCEGAVVDYNAINPSCTSDYHWYVDGGTLVDGQGTAQPVVQWSRTENGYGIIGLDGTLCGEEICPAMMSRKIPVISGNLAITGDSDVCVGESVVYTLPLFGSTEYEWHVTPSTGVDLSMLNPSNEARITFNAAGTYTVSCDYHCDFLGCGPYGSAPLTITVMPAFEIEGGGRVCVGNACSFSTVPAISADWKIYNLGAGNALVTTGSGTTFGYTFTSAGRFLVTAENANYCGPATFVVSVMAPPPAPTAADLAPDNRHAACPNSGLTLTGTPAEPSYTFVWAPACTSATPQTYSGENFTVHYASDVCDVLVYNYDRELQCRSTTAYVHQVNALTPAALAIPQPLTVCGGSTITWGPDEVPNQSADGMLYEWTIDENAQHCASVSGNHQQSYITLAVSDISPTTFDVNLKRTYCGGYHSDNIEIQIVNLSTNVIAIGGPNDVCRNSTAQFTAYGGTNHYQWNTRGYTAEGSPADLEFSYDGSALITLHDNPYTYCTRTDKLPSAVKTVTVKPTPPVLGLKRVDSGTLQDAVAVVSATTLGSGYSFQWQYKAPGSTAFGSPVTGGSSTGYVGAGIYRCTVSGPNGCAAEVEWDASVGNIVYGGNNAQMTISGVYNPCERKLVFTAPATAPYVSWAVERDGEYLVPNEVSGYLNHTATVNVDNVGLYYMRAYGFSLTPPSLQGVEMIAVEAIPDITLKPQCNSIELINNTIYANANTVLYIQVTNSYNNDNATILLQAGTPSYIYTPNLPYTSDECTFTFTLTGIGTSNSIEQCVLGTSTLPGQTLYPIWSNPVTITSDNAANGNTTCDNTPLGLTAHLQTGGSIASSSWTFGDGSTYSTGGSSVFHTFKYNDEPIGYSSYNVSVAVNDNYGCTWSTNVSLNVKSYPDPFVSNGALTVSPTSYCPYDTPRSLTYSINNTSYNYTWHSPNDAPVTNHNNTYNANYEGNYRVHVTNANNCKAEDIKYVSFKQAPTASIYAEKYNYCKGETVNLSGNPGPGSENYTYLWTVAPPSGSSLSFSTPDITFVATQSGTYNVTLDVSNSECTATTTATVMTSAPPAAPTLTISGSPCIADAPVSVAATGYSGEMHWSNGATGPTADYYYPGLVTAYYYDPTLGCPSANGEVRIERQPDLDALLTGCYLKCKRQASGLLPVYGLATDSQEIWWQWSTSAGATSGYHTGNLSPLMLPLGIGDHQLTVGTPGILCQQTSSVLRIEEKNVCDCEEVSVEYNVEPHFEECRLVYDVYITVCNHTDNKLCIGDLVNLNVTENIVIHTENMIGEIMDPYECRSFLLSIEALSFPPDVVLLQLVDSECSECTKDFSIVLPPVPVCVEPLSVNCGVIPELSSHVAGYFDFSLYVNPSENVIAVWSEPPMVVDWLDNGIGTINGLMMADVAVLSQLADEGAEVCFYAIVCYENEVCKRKVCVDARELYNSVAARGVVPRWMQCKDSGANPMNESVPRIIPNPATNNADVVADREILEVVVMDMYGRRMLEHGATSELDLSALASGTYIVRVRTCQGKDRADRVDYLKLVKR